MKDIIYRIALVFFLLNFLLFIQYIANFLLPGLTILPSVGTSECKAIAEGKSTNPFNVTECKIYPGSLVFVVDKSNPFGLNYVEKPNDFQKIITIIPIVLTTVSIISLIYKKGYNDTRKLWAFATVLFASYILLIAGRNYYTIGDIVCYESKENDFLICHTLIDKENDKFVVKGSASEYEESIDAGDVIGVVALRVPFIGAFNYSLEKAYQVFINMIYLIIFKHAYPLGIKIVYGV